MKMVFLLLLVQLLIGCTSKHKFLSKGQERAERKTTVKTDIETLHKNTAALYYMDSTQYYQRLKIYPKGMVSIGDNGFVGEADSLIWLSSGTSYQKKNAAQTQQVQQHITNTSVDSTAYLKRVDVKEKQKASFNFWPIALLAGLVGIFIYWRWRRG